MGACVGGARHARRRMWARGSVTPSGLDFDICQADDLAVDLDRHGTAVAAVRRMAPRWHCAVAQDYRAIRAKVV